MTTTNGWPGKPGVPLNPEQDGWHWVSLLGSEHPQIMEWFSDAMVWADGWTVEAYAKHIRYLGPCLTPDEATALQARADRNAAGFARVDAEAERDKFLHKQEIAALQKRVAELEGALRNIAADCESDCPPSHGAIKYAARAVLEGKKARPTMTEEQLREMMRDPRYWRQRNPEWVKRVTEGFRALVGGKDE